MTQETTHAPRLLFYPGIIILTELILVSIGAILLLPTGALNPTFAGVLGFVLAFKTLIACIVAILAVRNRWAGGSKVLAVTGHLEGRVVGLLAGGILGAKYAGWIGAVAGAIGLYFLGARIGSKISLAIGNRMGLLGGTSQAAEPPVALPSSRLKAWLGLGIGVILPLLLFASSLFLHRAGYRAQEYAQALPTARLIVIALSIGTVLIAWLIRWRARVKSWGQAGSLELPVFFIGAGASMAPALYGQLLFMAFGASMLEVLAFTLVSCTSGIAWTLVGLGSTPREWSGSTRG